MIVRYRRNTFSGDPPVMSVVAASTDARAFSVTILEASAAAPGPPFASFSILSEITRCASKTAIIKLLEIFHHGGIQAYFHDCPLTQRDRLREYGGIRQPKHAGVGLHGRQ
mgnify:CR=1 FL=1